MAKLACRLDHLTLVPAVTLSLLLGRATWVMVGTSLRLLGRVLLLAVAEELSQLLVALAVALAERTVGMVARSPFLVAKAAGLILLKMLEEIY